MEQGQDAEEEIYDTFSANQFYDFAGISSSDEENGDGFFGQRESILPKGKVMPSPPTHGGVFCTSPPVQLNRSAPLGVINNNNIMQHKENSLPIEKVLKTVSSPVAKNTASHGSCEEVAAENIPENMNSSPKNVPPSLPDTPVHSNENTVPAVVEVVEEEDDVASFLAKQRAARSRRRQEKKEEALRLQKLEEEKAQKEALRLQKLEEEQAKKEALRVEKEKSEEEAFSTLKHNELGKLEDEKKQALEQQLQKSSRNAHPGPMRVSHNALAASAYDSPKRKRNVHSRGRDRERRDGSKRPKRSNSPSYMRGTASSTSRDTASARLRNRKKSLITGNKRRSISRAPVAKRQSMSINRPIKKDIRRHSSAAKSSNGTSSICHTRPLTVPKTPNVLRRERSNARDYQPSYTSRELQKIQERKRVLEAAKPAREKAYRAAMSSVSCSEQVPPRSQKMLTLPKTPHLSTRDLPRAHEADALKKAAIDNLQNIDQGDQYSNSNLELTTTKPFHLASDARTGIDNAGSGLLHKLPGNPNCNMKTFAEKTFELTNRVPSRFHTVAPGELPKLPEYTKMQLTEPESPALATRDRNIREVNAKTREDRESDYMKNIRPFKARPLNARIIGDLGVPRMHKQPATIPNGPKLQTSTSNRVRKKSSFLDRVEKSKQFKAREMPANTFRPSSQIITRKPRKSILTVPQGPRLASTRRANVRLSMAGKQRESENEKARKCTTQSVSGHEKQTSKRFKHKNGKPVLCEPKSPTFMSQHRARLFQAQQRRKEKLMEEDKRHNFKAAEIMNYAKESQRGLSRNVPRRKLTDANFELSSQDRVNAAVEKAEMLKRDKENLIRNEALFKAREYRGPPKKFQVKKATTALTRIAPFGLKGGKRAEKRAKFELQMKKKEAAMKAEHLKKLEAEALAKTEEIKAIRKRQHFRALAMPSFTDGLSDCRSNKGVPRIMKRACTSPKSPNLSTSNRSRK